MKNVTGQYVAKSKLVLAPLPLMCTLKNQDQNKKRKYSVNLCYFHKWFKELTFKPQTHLWLYEQFKTCGHFDCFGHLTTKGLPAGCPISPSLCPLTLILFHQPKRIPINIISERTTCADLLIIQEMFPWSRWQTVILFRQLNVQEI